MTEEERKQYLIDFGKRVRLYREKLEMSQRELGRLAGYVDGANPASSISKIENGQMDITQTKIVDIAKALRIEPYENLEIYFLTFAWVHSVRIFGVFLFLPLPSWVCLAQVFAQVNSPHGMETARG